MKVQVISYFLGGKTAIIWIPNPIEQAGRQDLIQYQTPMTMGIGDALKLENYIIDCVEIHSATVLSLDVLQLLVPLFNIANKVSGITLLHLMLC